uniref:Hemicentin-1 n=1 Tax=Lygus hesperus TaxID=30085 RepID=A0A146LAE3_LYGHE
MKDDNAVSDDCFFPMGVYPVGGQTSKPITTMKRIFSTTTTESTTAKRTENPTSRRGEGGICFMRVNSNNKSECFYLDLNPSEAPRTETIATLAPHRIFEITEEPPPLPIETVSLLNPPVVVNQRPVGSGSATFAPDRIFEIPISGVNTKTKSQKPDGKSNAGNRYGQGGVDLRRVAPTTPGKPGWNILRAEHSLIQAGGKNEVRFQPRKSESIPYNERRNHNRFSHLIVGNGGTYNLRVNPEAGQKTDDQWDQSSSGNRSVLPLPRENPRSHQEGPRHPSRGGYSSTFLVGDGYQTKNRRPIGQAPLSYDNVVLIPTNDRRVQYPTSNLDMLSRDRSQLMPPVNRGYNEEAQVSNVRVNTLVPQAENNRNHAFLIPAERRMGGNYNPTFADDIRVYYPTIHLNRSAANRSPLTLVPVNPRYVQEEMVSNVRVNARYPQIGNRNVNYEDNRRNHQAFMIPVDRRSGEPGLSNIRIQLPQQGTFSQHAHVSNSDSQRSNFEHLYLGVHKGRPHEFDQRSRHTRAVKARPSIEETEAISLAFVVDTTASMNTELNEVKYYVSIIMDEVLNNRGSHIGNFIFVPIHDEIPAHEDYLVTRDRSKMAQTISAIRVSGGGKCPENSLIGLLKAIELSEKDSHIFLFTDAYAKDYNLVPTIIGMIQRKKPRVYFLLTGECKKPDNNAQKYAFDKIAAASTGIVARLVTDKTGEWSSMQLQKELHAVLEAVAREFEKNRRIVTEHEGSPTGTGSEDIKISVDPGLTNLSLTSTGHNTKINVTGPKGPPKDIVKVLDMPNIQILSVPKPDPGEWTVSVTSPESPFKIVASGISTTDFLYGFSVSPTIDTTRLSKHPMQGVRNHLLLVAKDPSVLANISNVQLVIGNRVFTTLPISVSNKERGIYSGGPILFPNDSFKIRINAFTKEGYPLTRLTKATIVPQMPGPPEIDCKKRMVATAGFPFNMTCSVESLIRMDIQIFKIGASSAHTVTHSHTSTVVLNFPQLEKKDSGTYIIQANNSAGFADQEIYLEVQAIAPTVNLVPEFVSFPGKRLVIKCDVSSYIDYTVSWSKKEAPIDNFYRTGAFNLIGNDDLKIQNDTIIIDPVRPEDKGWYICTARNEGGKKSARTYLTIQEKPSVSIERFNEYFRKGDRISLICRADKGIPVVSLSWYDNYGVVEPDSAIFTNKRVTQRRDGSLELLINDANKQDSGTYTCFGRNDAGRDSKPAVLQYVEKPIVEAREPRVQALTGERLTLECSCTGFPTPNITWSRMSSGSPNRTPLESKRFTRKIPGDRGCGQMGCGDVHLHSDQWWWV